MKCELCGKVPATISVTWGLYERTDPMNDAALCQPCSDDLWEKCKAAVNTGLMHWTNKAVDNKEEKQ